jgi:hypothetical protein
MSLLAGGYLTLDQALQYLQSLPQHVGVAVGASTRQHAEDTFNRLRALK